MTECEHCKNIKGGFICLDDDSKPIKLSEDTTGEQVLDISFWNDINIDLKELFESFENKKITEKELLESCHKLRKIIITNSKD